MVRPGHKEDSGSIIAAMTDASRFYALDLDHTLFDTDAYQHDYVSLAPQDRPVQMPALMYEEGRALLRELAHRDMPFGIITFGDPGQQLLKLQLAGLADIPFLIADSPEKAAAMKAWQRDGGFMLPGIFSDRLSFVKEIILVDDKAAAFHDMPDGIRGYLYRPSGRVVQEFQAGDVPASVKTIAHLLDVIS